MPNIKGTDVVLLRNVVKEKGPRIEGELLSKLTPELKKLYLETVATSWNPLDAQARLYETAAQVLFPSEPNAVVKVHRELAKLSYTGVYRVFMRVPTILFVAKRAASVWRSYYDKGDASVQNEQSSELDFQVADFRELNKTLRDATTGHLSTIMEMTGRPAVKVALSEAHENPWVWHISWTGK